MCQWLDAADAPLAKQEIAQLAFFFAEMESSLRRALRIWRIGAKPLFAKLQPSRRRPNLDLTTYNTGFILPRAVFSARRLLLLGDYRTVACCTSAAFLSC